MSKLVSVSGCNKRNSIASSVWIIFHYWSDECSFWSDRKLLCRVHDQYAMLCYAMLSVAMLYCAVLCYAMQCISVYLLLSCLFSHSILYLPNDLLCSTLSFSSAIYEAMYFLVTGRKVSLLCSQQCGHSLRTILSIYALNCLHLQ